MTETQRTDLAYISARAAEIAPLFAVPQAKELAGYLLETIAREYAACFAEDLARRQAAREKARAKSAERMAREGPKLWQEMHERALQSVTDHAAESAWLRAFASRLSCGECRAFYLNYLQTVPPDFANYFAWTVNLHNVVNVKLGKPQVGLEAARALWAGRAGAEGGTTLGRH